MLEIQLYTKSLRERENGAYSIHFHFLKLVEILDAFDKIKVYVSNQRSITLCMKFYSIA